jgi:membrane protein
LLAAGTTYFLFLAVFSLIAFAYGVVAILGADRVAELLTEAISEAFPGLLGEEGLDPQQLEAVGRATSIIGLLALVYSGSGGMAAASDSLHLIYGMPRDPRSFPKARARLLAWLLVIGPLIVLSFAASTVLISYTRPFLEAIGLDSAPARIGIRVPGLLLTFALDFLIVYILLGVLGGIRPPRRPRSIGAAVGAVAIEILKAFMAVLIGFSVDKPQYGALAAPIGMLFVLYLQTTALYWSAALTGGIAEKDVPIEELAPASDGGRPHG